MSSIRIGVFGVGRGMDIVKNFLLQGCELVAICDNHEERRDEVAKTLDKSVAVYDSFDEFLEHDMDAVIVANFFHEHAPYTIRLLEKGIHVFCECISNGTMAEGVQLVRAYERYKDRAIYIPEVTCTSRGNPGFPASTRERPRERITFTYSFSH